MLKMITKQNIVILLSVIVAASVVVGAVLLTKSKETTSISQNISDTPRELESKSATYKKYEALQGAAYDQAFLAGMVVHHGGALNMAEQARAATTNQEILAIADSINEVQGKETMDMNTMQTTLGFPVTSAHNMDNMNPGETMDETMAMYESLNEFSGDAFDEKFLEGMILHHQDAIDMSFPAMKNSGSVEVKSLAVSIISAQKEEIIEMKELLKKMQ
jgi:uncharacterized protein (DUF305 family)